LVGMEASAQDGSPELLIAPELAPGERLLWSGRPNAGGVGGKALAIVFAGGIALCLGLYAAVWGLTKATHGPPAPPAAFWFMLGTGIVMGGAVAGVLSLQSRQLRGLVYGVTEKRVIVATIGAARSVLSWDGAKIAGAIEKVERPDGSGDLLFRSLAQGFDPALPAALSTAKYSPRIPGLYGLADVRTVERVVRQAFSKPQSP
jgi:hypothetical protein